MAVAADQQVLQHRGVLEQFDVLEGAGNTVARDDVRRHARDHLALEAHFARGRPVQRRNQVEDRGLAGAVRPDQGKHFVGPDVEGDVVYRHQAAEAHRQVGRLQHRSRHALLRSWLRP